MQWFLHSYFYQLLLYKRSISVRFCANNSWLWLYVLLFLAAWLTTLSLLSSELEGTNLYFHVIVWCNLTKLLPIILYTTSGTTILMISGISQDRNFINSSYWNKPCHDNSQYNRILKMKHNKMFEFIKSWQNIIYINMTYYNSMITEKQVASSQETSNF